MKLSFVLRDKSNALRLSTRTIESFIERIKTDTKEGTVVKRRRHLLYSDNLDSYDKLNPSHLIYPSVEFERDANDNLKMRTFNTTVKMKRPYGRHVEDFPRRSLFIATTR